MLPLQQPTAEKRPRVNPLGAPSLVIPPKTDTLNTMLSYDEYEELMPDEADLVPFDEPVVYWNPIDPGSAIKPWPQLPMLSDSNGMIVCWNLAEEKAWRQKLAQYSGDNPDKWKGNGGTDGSYFFECETCHFKTTNPTVWTDHVRWWKHK